MTVIRHVVFSGRVQGVGFRAHVEDLGPEDFEEMTDEIEKTGIKTDT